MGFDQDKTTHHFRLTANGGIIQVEVNDPADNANLNLIRTHLMEIAGEFRKGNFQKPLLTHDEVPPGVPAMQQLNAYIAYDFNPTSTGALVRIRSSRTEAIKSIHDFLRYQIKEHATGDSLTILKAAKTIIIGGRLSQKQSANRSSLTPISRGRQNYDGQDRL